MVSEVIDFFSRTKTRISNARGDENQSSWPGEEGLPTTPVKADGQCTTGNLKDWLNQ